MHIGENIRQHRKQKGFSQKELAGLISLDATQLNRIETGKSEPSLKTLKMLVDTLEISLDELVYGNEDVKQEINVENKSILERLKLINELNEDDRGVLLKMIDIVLTKQKFTDFFKQQIS